MATLQTAMPASSYPYMVAYVTDGPNGAGYVVSDGTSWGVGGALNAIGVPNTRTLALATAYQATNPAKPSIWTVNITSDATMSLSGGTTNTANVVIGSTNAVASGTGTAIGKYKNANTGALTIGLSLVQTAMNAITVALPAGWYIAIRQITGTVSIDSAFDQAMG